MENNKKFYQSPQCEVHAIEIEVPILQDSTVDKPGVAGPEPTPWN